MPKIKVMHIITSLHVGGAQTMLLKLLANINKEQYQCEIVSLIGNGDLTKKIEDMGIKVHSLGMKRGGINIISSFFKLISILKKMRPDVVQTWMYHSDLIGGISAKVAGIGSKVVWGIHHSNLSPDVNKKMTLFIVKMCSFFSRWIPEKIVCCSEATKRVHYEYGYDFNKLVVIPNGFDLEDFKPNSNYRKKIREQLGINENQILLGKIARFHPQKDHENLIKAFSILLSQNNDVYLLLCGDGMEWSNRTLVEWIDQHKIPHDRIFLLGRRMDIPKITTALDLAVSSSCGEGFPSVVGEAMACEVPAVVTDVGDSRIIVGDTGLVVKPKDPKSLASACLEFINMDKKRRVEMGVSARNRILKKYEIGIITQKYMNLYKEIIS